MDPRSGIAIGLHHYDANPGQLFHESQTGLDHISFGLPNVQISTPGQAGSTSSASSTPA
jgi:hypothetical protein